MKRNAWIGMAAAALALLSLGQNASAQRISDLPKLQQKPTVQPNKTMNNAKAGEKFISLPLDVLTMYLKLTKEQSDKIAPILKKVQGEVMGLVGTRPDPANADPAKLFARAKALNVTIEQGEKDIAAVLTEEQKKKVEPMFEEVRLLKSVGVSSAGIAAVKLTDDQKKKILTIAEDYQKKRQELAQEERSTKGAQLAKEYRDKAAQLLTEEQKQALEKAIENDPLSLRHKTP